MKSLLLLLLPFFITATTLAQGTEATPSERFPSLPPFTIQGLDSSNFTKADLSKNKKTLIMYFSPGCDHCQHETEALLKDIELFKDVQIVMASYQPIEEIAGFHKKYNLANYPQIKIGRDTN
ncbi:MAG: redoxin domain-containing protein, partial [Chitinophagaceae bacterium]|nr:redoxin domain-containing protein [Chitinophagaceae bacterium]